MESKGISILYENLDMYGIDNAMSKKLDSYLTASNFYGAVLIAHKGAVAFRKGYGYANRATDVLNQPETTFRIASITKMLTAVAVLKLQEQDMLRVSDPLSMYIHDYPRGNKITLHHLLSMTSGIANCVVTRPERARPVTLEQWVDMIKSTTPLCDPGKNFHYSNSNYVLLSCIIEKASGMTYAAYLQKHIFDVLGMCNSYVDDGSSRVNQALGYTLQADQFTPSAFYDPSWTFGSGNVQSTVDDLYLFDKGLHAGMLLSADSLVHMQTAVAPTNWDYWAQKGSSYGYGLVISPAILNREMVVGHAGGTGSFSSYLFRFLSSDISIIVLTNYDNFDSYAQPFFEGLENIVFSDH